MRAQIRALEKAVALSVACLFCIPALAADSLSAVQSSLGGLESWLGDGSNGKAWKTFLDLPALDAEVAKKEKADPAVVEKTLKQLQSGAKGLELEHFAKLRGALEAWNGELQISKFPTLAAAAQSFADKAQPISADEVASRKKALTEAVAKLEKYLTGANGQAWKKYLKLEDLQAQLKSDTPDVEALRTLQRQFVADQVGLEMPVFSGVAVALDRYTNALAGSKGDLTSQYAEQIKGLEEDLQKYAESPNEELALSLGNRLGWLESMQQADPLVLAIRAKLSQPNLFVRVSERLAAVGFDQPVDEVAPVSDNILGTSISGTGHTVGRITTRFLPDDNRAMLEMLLSGNVSTNTVGYNGPATIYSSGNTAISGLKRVVIDEKGLASWPATAAARTRTNINGVSAGGALVQRIASRKVGESKAQAEQIGSDHAADRVRARVEKQAVEQLSKAHAQYLQSFRNPLVRRQEFPSLLKFRTTEDELFLTALQANRNQVAAPTPAPPITVASDLAVQFHESAFNNMAAALLSGVTLHEEEVQKKVIELRGELPEQLKSDEDRDPWSITFAKSRPVTIKVLDNGIQITVRGQRYTSGDRDFRAMNVTAEYKFEQTPPGVRLVRQGELTILPPNFQPGQRLSPQQLSWKTTLAKKFGRMFEPEIKSEGLVLPGRWRDAGRLDLKQLQTSGGWIALAWLESGVPAPPEVKKDKMATR